MSNEKLADSLRTVISFLSENEQFGDDWSEEITDLETILDNLQNEPRKIQIRDDVDGQTIGYLHTSDENLTYEDIDKAVSHLLETGQGYNIECIWEELIRRGFNVEILYIDDACYV